MPKDKHSYKRLHHRPLATWRIPNEGLGSKKKEGTFSHFLTSWKCWIACLGVVLLLMGLANFERSTGFRWEDIAIGTCITVLGGSLLFAIIQVFLRRDPPQVSLFSDALVIGAQGILKLKSFSTFVFRERSHGFRTLPTLRLRHKHDQEKHVDLPLPQGFDSEILKIHLQAAGLTFVEDISGEAAGTPPIKRGQKGSVQVFMIFQLGPILVAGTVSVAAHHALY